MRPRPLRRRLLWRFARARGRSPSAGARTTFLAAFYSAGRLPADGVIRVCQSSLESLFESSAQCKSHYFINTILQQQKSKQTSQVRHPFERKACLDCRTSLALAIACGSPTFFIFFSTSLSFLRCFASSRSLESHAGMHRCCENTSTNIGDSRLSGGCTLGQVSSPALSLQSMQHDWVKLFVFGRRYLF